MTDKDTDPAGAAGPGDADVCAETTAGAAGGTGAAPGEPAGRLGVGGLDLAAVLEAASAVARYEVSG